VCLNVVHFDNQPFTRNFSLMKRSAINRRIPFLKMHALGNHFVLVDARKRPFSPDLATITEMCRHHSGIGAEQLLVLTRSPTADATLDIYNVDGFRAEACGNATRCVAWYLMDQTNQETTSITCNDRTITGKVIDDLTVQVDLGEVSYLPQHKEVSAKRWGSFEHGFAIDVGNPHLVFLTDECSQQALATVAPSIQADPSFPDGVNVTLAHRHPEGGLRTWTYERAVGFTAACGTGAVASAFAASQHLSMTGTIPVHMAGGTVSVVIDESNHAHLTGPVTLSFRGYW
jgi:diaminopimelate epimerase